MRKVILQEWISIDGFAADDNNSSAFMETQSLNKDSDHDMLEFMDSIDTVILGSNTYKLFVDYWPTDQSKDEVVAEKVNELSKIVVSTSLQTAPWGKWPEAKIINTDAVEAIRRLKSAEGKDIALWGSISLAQSFMKADLVDEFHLRIVPIVLGAGRALFENVSQIPFELIDIKRYESGLTLLQYKRKE